ncbi:CDGSH iron sulfur domain-containing protein 2-like protein [Zootermopsis nevadensis]|uniref:CDGSH iron-sulfur domain-containing protein 2 homologue n=1 Tax=Zootermopsis nevadensis TaxID=136037 RepID=A0A067RU36_ZOONE|nr:CDGSH iron sulfur domain-containing protein 2-like protein [Zootermopsis nevadensis]
MEPISNIVKVTLPNYLSGLPIPSSLCGWFKLGVRDWVSLVPFGAAIAGITYMSYRAFCPLAKGHCSKVKRKVVNPDIQKENAKVVDSFDVEDIGEKAVFCRCWRSKKFPYCDGAHGAHNKETGDNVGPICILRKNK